MAPPTQQSFSEIFIAKAQLLVIPLFPVSVSLCIFLYGHPRIKIVPVELFIAVALHAYSFITGSILLIIFERAASDPEDRKLIRVLHTSFHLSAVTGTSLLLICAFILNDFGDYLKYLLLAVDICYLAISYMRDELRVVPAALSRRYDSLVVLYQLYTARIQGASLHIQGASLHIRQAYRLMCGGTDA